MEKTIIKKTDWISVFCCYMLAILLLRSSKAVGAGVRDGLTLCANVVIPSLFPFLALSGFVALSRCSIALGRMLSPITRHVFHLPDCAASPLLMGMIGGYPVGARALSALVRQKRLPPRLAGHMLCFCSNAGPPFLLCAVGLGMFGSLKLGILLLTAQAASALLIGFAMGRTLPRPVRTPVPGKAFAPYSVCFVQAVGEACSGMLSICAFVVLFSAVASLLSAYGLIDGLAVLLSNAFPTLDAQLLQGGIFGLLEVTTGCSILGGCGYAGICTAAALLSFSGLSVIFQVLAVLHGSGIPVRGFLLSRFAHAALTLFLFGALLRLFPQALPASLSLSYPLRLTAGSNAGGLSLLAMCLLWTLVMGNRLSFTSQETIH